MKLFVAATIIASAAQAAPLEKGPDTYAQIVNIGEGLAQDSKNAFLNAVEEQQESISDYFDSKPIVIDMPVSQNQFDNYADDFSNGIIDQAKNIKKQGVQLAKKYGVNFPSLEQNFQNLVNDFKNQVGELKDNVDIEYIKQNVKDQAKEQVGELVENVVGQLKEILTENAGFSDGEADQVFASFE